MRRECFERAVLWRVVMISVLGVDGDVRDFVCACVCVWMRV